MTSKTNSIEALEKFKNNPDEYDLIITDQTMPNMTGRDLAKEIMFIRPDVPIILCTGFREQIDEMKAKEMGNKCLCNETDRYEADCQYHSGGFGPSTFKKENTFYRCIIELESAGSNPLLFQTRRTIRENNIPLMR